MPRHFFTYIFVFGGSAKLDPYHNHNHNHIPIYLLLLSLSPPSLRTRTRTRLLTRDNEVPRYCILSRSLGCPRRCPGCCTRSQHPVRFLPASPIPDNAHESSAALVYKNASIHNSPGLEALVPLKSPSFLVRHCPHALTLTRFSHPYSSGSQPSVPALEVIGTGLTGNSFVWLCKQAAGERISFEPPSSGAERMVLYC